jgi:SPP1 gp7 family putative phage head morphogenesis protein
MTIQKLQELGYTLTEKEANLIYKKVYEEYKKALLSVKGNVKDTYSKYLTGEDTKNWLLIMNGHNRLDKLKSSSAKIMSKSLTKIKRLYLSASELAFRNNYYRQMYAAQWLLEKDTFVNVNEHTVMASVAGEYNKCVDVNVYPKYGKLVDTLNKNKQVTINKLDSIITQAILNGNGINEVSKQIANVLNTSMSSATRIARTEMMRNLNTGAYTSFVEMSEKGANIKRQYLAALDTRTREQSSRMDGQIANKDGFLYPNGNRYQIIGNTGVARYDINDRCTEVKIIEDIPLDTRSGRNPVTGKTEIIDYVTMPQWMKNNGLFYDKNGKIVSK